MIIPSLAYQHQRGRHFAAMLLTCLFFLGSCGQTGALYLPESQVQTDTAALTEPVANDNAEGETSERHPRRAEDPAVDALP